MHQHFVLHEIAKPPPSRAGVSRPTVSQQLPFSYVTSFLTGDGSCQAPLAGDPIQEQRLPNSNLLLRISGQVTGLYDAAIGCRVGHEGWSAPPTLSLTSITCTLSKANRVAKAKKAEGSLSLGLNKMLVFFCDLFSAANR
jgi:hypothetical protein